MADKNTPKDHADNDITGKEDAGKSGGKWSTGAKVGAAVGSAALLGALLYAGRYAMKGKVEPQSPDGDTQDTPKPPPGEQFESD